MNNDTMYLIRHGIAGQKWGQQNGPPYPLDYDDHSVAEKRGDYQSSDQKKKDKPLKKTGNAIKKIGFQKKLNIIKKNRNVLWIFIKHQKERNESVKLLEV